MLGKCLCSGPSCIVLGESCRDMRMLFFHSKKCKQDNCNIENCGISRYISYYHNDEKKLITVIRTVLSHFSNCQDLDCRFCKPVRIAMLKKSPKERGIYIENWDI